MGPGRCESCRAEVPADAAFCPRCGAAVGGSPVLPLLPATPTGDRVESEPDSSSDRPGRTVLAVVLAVVVVLIGLSTFSGGGSDADEDPDTTTTTRPTTSTTTEPSTTTTSTPDGEPAAEPPSGLLADGETLSPSFGAALVRVAPEVTTVVDLATGAEATAPTLPGQPAQLSWSGETLLAMTHDALYRWATDGSGQWEQVDLGGWRPLWIGRGGMVSASAFETNTGRLAAETFLHVGADGEVGTWRDVQFSTYVTPFGASTVGVVGDDLVMSTFDGIFRITQAGEARRITHGQTLAVRADRMLRSSCDDQMNCGLSVLDLGSGEERSVPDLPPGFQPMGGFLSPDGTGMVISGFDPAASMNPQVTLALVRGTWVDSGGGDNWRPESVVWGHDSSGIVWWNGNDFTVRAMALVGPRAGTATSVQVDRNGLMAGPGTPTTAVVPLDVLPESWRPASPG